LFWLKNQKIALKEAIKSAKKALLQANGFYKNDLIAFSEVLNIQAKLYNFIAQEDNVETEISNLKNNLSFLIEKKVDDIEKLPYLKINIPKTFQREDVKISKTLSKIAEIEKEAVYGKLYPQLFLEVVFRRYGENFKLNSDKFKNPNQNYFLIGAKYPLFDGGKRNSEIETASKKQLSYKMHYLYQKKLAQVEVENEIRKLYSLKRRILSAKKEEEARKSYYILTYKRFLNQLVSSYELSESIADYFLSKANVAKLEAEIFNQKCKVLLSCSLKTFLDEIKKAKRRYYEKR
jgi:outer membrane protein TolC